MKVNPADPGCNRNPDQESEKRARRAENSGFRRKEAIEQPPGGAQGLHDGKIAPPVKYPSHQRGKYA